MQPSSTQAPLHSDNDDPEIVLVGNFCQVDTSKKKQQVCGKIHAANLALART